MRGQQERSGSLFSYVSIEDRILENHPLRRIRRLANQALDRLNPSFCQLYVSVRQLHRHHPLTAGIGTGGLTAPGRDRDQPQPLAVAPERLDLQSSPRVGGSRRGVSAIHTPERPLSSGAKAAWTASASPCRRASTAGWRGGGGATR